MLISIPPVKQRAITAVRAVVDGKLRKFHGPFSCCEEYDTHRCRFADNAQLNRLGASGQLPPRIASVAQAAGESKLPVKPLFRRHVIPFQWKRPAFDSAA
jgi:hypothetical protein